MSDVSEWYDEFSEKQVNWGINQRHRSIMSKITFHGLEPEHNVLEIGAGIGTQSQLIAQFLSTGKLLINDISPKSIDIGKKRLRDFSNVDFLTGDIVELPIDRTFDAIVCPDVLEHIPVDQHNRLFRKFNEILKPDGRIYIHIPDPDFMEWQYKHQPEVLQVIDQALYLPEMISNFKGTDLYLHHMETYELFFQGGDYRFIILRKRQKKEFIKIINPGVRLHKRLLNRVKLATQVLVGGSKEEEK